MKKIETTVENPTEPEIISNVHGLDYVKSFDDFRVVADPSSPFPDLFLNGAQIKSWIKYTLEQGMMESGKRSSIVTIKIFVNLEIESQAETV